MSDGRKHCIPVTETIFLLYNLLVFWFQDIEQVDTLAAAIGTDQLFPDTIVFFKFFLEPLIDLILCLCTLDNVKPVTARSL